MNPVNGLALGRIVIGATALASPDRAAKMFRIDMARNPQLGYMMRMFGSREIALGALTLLAKGKARRKLVALGMAVDGADAFAGYDAMRSGSVPQSVGLFLTGPALGAVLTGAVGIATER
jgi:uncharacterized protein DUF4267